jgi:hypothetical protein
MGQQRARDCGRGGVSDEGKSVVTIEWQGVTVLVSYSPSDIMAHAHIELRVPDKRRLPVTETGYRSHFLPRGVVEAAGGPEAFVKAWLDEEAKTSKWKKQAEADRQLSLF